MRIGLDVMGGDFAPAAPIEGAVDALLRMNPDAKIVLIGQSHVIDSELAKHNAIGKFEVVTADEVIGMDDHPAKSITQKPNSSINIGIQMVKSGQLDAFISAGNTGAMMVGSVLGLGNIDGVQRPTIGILYPCKGNQSFLCDVGANVDCKPEHLVQFAMLGNVFMKAVLHNENPRVALLNIGEEKSKGNQQVLQTYQLLEQEKSLNFIGNVEGRDMNEYAADVYVCDGFTGNILLKYGESLYDLFIDKLPNDPEIQAFSFEHYGGSALLGVKGNIIIGHGISGKLSFTNMLLRAQEIISSNLVQKITEAFQPLKNA